MSEKQINSKLPSGICRPKEYFLSIKVVVVQSLSHVRVCDPRDCSTPGFPVLHHLLELAQTCLSRIIQKLEFTSYYTVT